jgi:branched-chain amino acid aminotransferase
MTETQTIAIQKVSKSRLPDVDFDHIPFGRIFTDHMFVADYADGQWKNLRIQPYGPMALTPSISALHYGQSIFEGMKAYRMEDGSINLFRPFDNLKRIQTSAERMCMPFLPEEVFMEGLKALLHIDQAWVPEKETDSLYIRPFMFATDDYVGIRPSDTYSFVIFCCPVGAYYSEPVKVKVETYYSRSMEGGTGFAKAAGNYAAALYPAKQAQAKGYHQLVWTDSKTHQFIEESGTMNVMFVVGETLITAPADEKILKGVTRDSVLTLARDWGLNVEERPVRVSEIAEALKKGTLKEAFGTGTAATIAHIVLMNIEGDDYHLPPVEGRVWSNRFLKTLDDIKRGKMIDKFAWNFIL